MYRCNSCLSKQIFYGFPSTFSFPFFSFLIDSKGNHEQTCEQHPADCYQCQMAKLFDGLHSGRYSKKKELQRIGEKKEGEEKKEEAKKVDNEEEQRGVGPRMFKRLISKGHEDFSSMQQQDAYEFYQHLVKMVERFERLFFSSFIFYDPLLTSLQAFWKGQGPFKMFVSSI